MQLSPPLPQSNDYNKERLVCFFFVLQDDASVSR